MKQIIFSTILAYILFIYSNVYASYPGECVVYVGSWDWERRYLDPELGGRYIPETYVFRDVHAYGTYIHGVNPQWRNGNYYKLLGTYSVYYRENNYWYRWSNIPGIYYGETMKIPDFPLPQFSDVTELYYDHVAKSCNEVLGNTCNDECKNRNLGSPQCPN